MNKILRRTLLIVLAVALVFTASACGKATTTETDTPQPTATPAEKPDPYSKMPELIEFTTGKSLPLEPKFPEGEDYDNNDITKWVIENLNVKQKTIWTTSDQNMAYDNKLNMLIASSDIPDVFSVSDLRILRKLVDLDMIEDITQVWNDYASPTLKEFHGKSDNAAINEVTFNGKMMAFPTLADTETAIPLIWVRQDWLDKVGMQAPRTVDDCVAIAKAFMEKDPDGNGKADTVGLPAQSKLFKQDTASFDYVFGANNSYPGDWIRLADGTVGYGSVQPETKTALAKLQDMFKAGVIDKEFPVKDPGKAVELVTGGKAGIFMGAWWTPWWPLPDSVKNDKNANWKAYFITADDGKCYAKSYAIIGNSVVIKKGFKSPVAIMKVINWGEDAGLKKLDWYNKLEHETGAKYGDTAVGLWPVSASAKYQKEISIRCQAVLDVVDGKTAMADADAETQNIAKQCIDYNNATDKFADMGTWSLATSWFVGASTFFKYDIQQKLPAFPGSTELMIKKKVILEDLEMQTFLKIILNQAPVDEFDKFVEQWNNLGGADITKEINEICKK